MCGVGEEIVPMLVAPERAAKANASLCEIVEIMKTVFGNCDGGPEW